MYVLPAYAGMILGGETMSWRYFGAPRVCGDDPFTSDLHESTAWCSPRMRG